MAKSIKNYTTKVPVARTVAEIQEILAKNGASAIILNYEQDTGRIESLSFEIALNEQRLVFRLPTNYQRFQEILQRDKVARWNDTDHVYRVAWRNLLDWVEIQMVMYQLGQVELAEVFLPYAITKDGSTFFKYIQTNPQLLLGSGHQ